MAKRQSQPAPETPLDRKKVKTGHNNDTEGEQEKSAAQDSTSTNDDSDPEIQRLDDVLVEILVKRGPAKSC